MRISPIIFSIVIALVVIAGALWFFVRDTNDASLAAGALGVPVSPEVVQIADFEYEIVASLEARTLGLSGRTEISENYGMLFVFPEAERHGFWMKDMFVPIDIIWLANDGTVIGIDPNITPDTYPTPYFAPAPVARVLETKAGEAARQGWVVGSKITLPL